MDVRMPDGTIISNVPEGTTQEEVEIVVGTQMVYITPSLLAVLGS